jgi:hypothetical protein
VADDAEAIEAGEHEVEEEEVVVGELGQAAPSEPVLGAVDGEAAALAQGCGDVVGEAEFIFDDEDSHRGMWRNKGLTPIVTEDTDKSMTRLRMS